VCDRCRQRGELNRALAIYFVLPGVALCVVVGFILWRAGSLTFP
jgi:hypothetical protein